MPSVLVVSMNYWPEETGIGPYSTGLAEHLARSGHEVTVLAGMPHYPRWSVAPTYRGRWRLSESRNGVTILRRRHYVPGRQSAIRRAAFEATWLMHAGVTRLATRPDAVIGVVPSLSGGIVARFAAARAQAAYGVVVQDLVAAAAAQSGIRGGRSVAAVTQQMEDWVLRRATVVAPVTDAFRPALKRSGVPDDRIVILPNWSHVAGPTLDRSVVRERLGWPPDEFVALHAGNMGLKQGLDQIVAAARLATQTDTPVRLVLMGDGSQRHRLIELAEGVGRLEIRPFVPSSELPDVLAAADVLIVSERPSVVDMSLPSKLTSYFAAGRPVVAAVNPAGASAQELQRAGAGVVAPAADPSALLGAIMAIHDLPDQGRAFGKAGQEYASTTLSPTTTFDRADVILDRLLEKTSSHRRTVPQA